MTTRHQRIGSQFEKELREIKALRRLDIDMKFPREISTERLTDGITQFPEWDSIKNKLIKEPRKVDKIKGGRMML